jgi:hypothetical protein
MIQSETAGGLLSADEASIFISELNRIRLVVERTPEEDAYLRSAADSMLAGGGLGH